MTLFLQPGDPYNCNENNNLWSEDDEAANNPAAEIWTKSSFEARFGKKIFRVIFNKFFTVLFNAALTDNLLCEAEVGSR